MEDNFQPIDFSKYAELRDLWDKHPSNKEGAYSRGDYSPAEGEAAQVLNRYGALSQQLADELGGGDRAAEAMLALGAVGGIGNGLTEENLGDSNYYSKMMARRNEYLSQGHSVAEADAIEPYRFASVIMGERQPDLNYVQADRARRYASQYGTPDQIDYTNQLATQLRSAQPQGMFGQLTQSSQPIDMYSTTSKYFQPELQNIQLSNTKKYLQSLDNTGYLSLLSKMLGR